MQPDNKREIKLDALLFDNYHLIFSNQFKRTTATYFQNLKSSNNLPENFPDSNREPGQRFFTPYIVLF